MDVVDDVFISERIHPRFGTGEDLSLFVPGGLVLVSDGVGQVEATEVTFNLTTTIGTRLIRPVNTDLARDIQLGITTLGSDAAVQEFQLHRCVGEAETTFRGAIFGVVAPRTASEGEFVFLVDRVIFGNGQVIGTEAAQIQTYGVPGITGVEVKSGLNGGMAQVGLVFAFFLGCSRVTIDALTITLEVEQTAGQFGVFNEGFIGLAVFRAHHILSCQRHTGGDQSGYHSGTQSGALEDHFFHFYCS